MAYADPITVADNAAANQTFTLQSRQSAGSDWVESDATPTDMRKIVFRNSNAGASVAKGAKPVRRHLVQFSHEKWNSTLGKTEKAILNVTLTVDPGASFTTTNIYDLRAFAENFLSNTTIDQMLRDET